MSRWEGFEERVFADPLLIARLRERLVEFLDRVSVYMVSGRGDAGFVVSGVGCVSGEDGWVPGRVAVVDGGSNVIGLNAGYVGVVASLGIVVEDNRVVGRVLGEPEIVPGDPAELGLFETAEQVSDVVDKVREAKVFEVALKLLGWKPDLLVVDGPLIPYGALGKIIVGSRVEKEALERYRRAVVELHEKSMDSATSIVGFVKRPRSRYLSIILGRDLSFDHVVLSRVLGEGEYYPEPPRDVPASPMWFHEPSILEVVGAIKPRFTFLRTNKSLPPFRVDFGSLVHDYKDILGYLFATRTCEGIPYMVMKADEEVKITRKLIRELYEDALHSCIMKYLGEDFSKLIPLLPEYGGV